MVNISFGGYLDRSDPDQDAIYKQYVETIRYALRKGTLIVAAAGNEHVRVGTGGLVLSHGSLTYPGEPLIDYYGLWELPGGVPGVIDVSSTGNVVAKPSDSCAADTVGAPDNPNATCKPTSDAHQSFGVGRKSQLAYYSNYGPRIDVAAPGGTRKFNVPNWDRGGTPGWPVTDADGFKAWEDFGITSNWAMEIPCYVIDGFGFPANESYSNIQGTSMATPHAAAAAALIASRNPWARGHAVLISALLKATAQDLHGNTTPPLSATDTSPGDLIGVPCETGYCHLAGKPISDKDAYGAGLVTTLGDVGQH